MSRNAIFLAVVGGAILIAVLMGSGVSSNKKLVISGSIDSDNSPEIHFAGDVYRCDEETGSVTITHEDGAETTIYCD